VARIWLAVALGELALIEPAGQGARAQLLGHTWDVSLTHAFVAQCLCRC